MKRMFLVSVETDDGPADTLDTQTIMNEIEQNLLYEAHQFGIVGVSVMSVEPEDLCSDIRTFHREEGYGHGV